MAAGREVRLRGLGIGVAVFAAFRDGGIPDEVEGANCPGVEDRAGDGEAADGVVVAFADLWVFTRVRDGDSREIAVIGVTGMATFAVSAGFRVFLRGAVAGVTEGAVRGAGALAAPAGFRDFVARMDGGVAVFREFGAAATATAAG
jgi:hypothetical protein